MKITYRERALADSENIFQYLNERSPSGARNVLRAIADLITRDRGLLAYGEQGHMSAVEC